MSQPQLTVAAVERFDRDLETRRLRRALREARDTARTTREHVDSYILPLFQTFRFLRSACFAEQRAGEPINHPRYLYLTDQEEDVKRFYAACDEAHQEHGYELPGPGYCPALMAEHSLTQAENALPSSSSQYPVCPEMSTSCPATFPATTCRG